MGDVSVLNTTFWSLQPVFWLIDFFVLLSLPVKSDPPDVPSDPVKVYRHERMRDYLEKRIFTLAAMRPQLFSLGLESRYKHDEVSWLGICWRSCLVAGIAIYNVWFWFGGITLLNENSRPTYIFLFYKANIYSGAGTFYKALSILCHICWHALPRMPSGNDGIHWNHYQIINRQFLRDAVCTSSASHGEHGK